MKDGEKGPDTDPRIDDSVNIHDRSDSGESAPSPRLDAESDDEPPELESKLHPVASVEASPCHMDKYQEPSPPSHVASVSGSMSFLSTMEGWFHSIPELFHTTILKEADTLELADAIESQAEELLSKPEVAQKNIFDQIEGIQDPEKKQALRYSYEIYSCVQALCCMAHDKIAMAFIQMLKKILKHYVGFVKGIEGDSQEKRFHSGRMLQTLVTELQKSFETSFRDRGFKTVGQETCRAAGELTITKYCEWLQGHGIVVEPPLIACMISRAAAKSVLEQCREKRRQMYDSDEGSSPEQKFYRVIMDSDGIIPDSVPVMDEKKLVGSDGLSIIDASPLPNYDAVFLCFQGQEAKFHSKPHSSVVKRDTSLKASGKSSVKRQSTQAKIVLLSDETPELLAKFNVFDSSNEEEDEDKWLLHLGADRANKSIPIPHLSCGIAFLTCVPFFDIDKVDSKFFKIFKKNHNNPFFKPLQLTYMPTALFESMVKDSNKRKRLIEDFEKRLNSFLSRIATTAEEQAGALGLEYVTPTVYRRVTKDGILQTLVSVTAGTFSNDTSSSIISRVNPEIFNSAARGRTSAAGCIKKAEFDFCYMGQDMTDDELQREAESSGLVVVTITAANKEFGDLAKALELHKAMAVIPGPFVTLFATGDHMAGTAACLTGLRVCTYGATVIVRTAVDAVNEKLTTKIRGTIAALQAKMIVLDKTHGEHYLYEKLQSWFKNYRAEVKKSINGAVKELKRGRSVLAVELLPALLTYMYKLEKFDDDDYLVTQQRFDEIVRTKLNHKTHLGTQSELDFISLVVNPEELRKVMAFDGLLMMASEKMEYVTPTGAQLKTDDLMPFVKNEIDELCKCNGSFTTYHGNVFTIDEPNATAYAIDILEEIFIKLPLFSLLQRYKTFISQKELLVNFKDAKITVSMPDMKVALDKAVKKLLKADILTNTKRSEYRHECVTHAESIFESLEIDARTQEEKEFLQAYDSVGRGEDHARTHTPEFVLGRDCLVMAGSIDSTEVDDNCPFRFLSNPRSKHREDYKEEDLLLSSEVEKMIKEIIKEREQKEAAAAAAAASAAPAAAAAPVEERPGIRSLLQKSKSDERDLNRAQKQELLQQQKRRRGGGTRKKSKIQKRKITRKYKGKNSRHNHTIKNRHIRNYSLRNKQ